jgi:hypothetical protein
MEEHWMLPLIPAIVPEPTPIIPALGRDKVVSVVPPTEEEVQDRIPPLPNTIPVPLKPATSEPLLTTVGPYPVSNPKPYVVYPTKFMPGYPELAGSVSALLAITPLVLVPAAAGAVNVATPLVVPVMAN